LIEYQILNLIPIMGSGFWF